MRCFQVQSNFYASGRVSASISGPKKGLNGIVVRAVVSATKCSRLCTEIPLSKVERMPNDLFKSNIKCMQLRASLLFYLCFLTFMLRSNTKFLCEYLHVSGHGDLTPRVHRVAHIKIQLAFSCSWWCPHASPPNPRGGGVNRHRKKSGNARRALLFHPLAVFDREVSCLVDVVAASLMHDGKRRKPSEGRRTAIWTATSAPCELQL